MGDTESSCAAEVIGGACTKAMGRAPKALSGFDADWDGAPDQRA